jgi:hypothetical protein
MRAGEPSETARRVAAHRLRLPEHPLTAVRERGLDRSPVP